MSILDNKNNIYSQNGEDGIIQYIFNKMNINNGNFIEFGAWDGIYFSNTYQLFKNGWNGVYIEADEIKFKQLQKNFNNFNNITLINNFVSFNNNNNLDTIIDNSNFNNKNFDFISIDVDGLDYYIFKDMKKYLPKVICIEVCSGHSPIYNKEIDMNIAYNNIGQSLYIMSKLAEEKEYFPLCYTGNLFLVKNEYKELFKDDIYINLEDMYIDFLNHIEYDLILYLYNLFIVKKIYNGFYFENEFLSKFCKRKLNII